jgi:hypothetical protein
LTVTHYTVWIPSIPQARALVSSGIRHRWLQELPMKKTAVFSLALLPLVVAGFLLLPQAATPQSSGQKAITTPKQHLGANIGDDYFLANYQQLKSYWEILATQSERFKLVTIGKTEEGRPQLLGIVTSPANHKKLEHYREISRRLANAEGVSPAEAAKLATEGKAVVWIDGGLHASEVLCAQVLIEMVYQLLTATDPETLRILDDVIILFVHANPDGMDLLADHYMREKNPKNRSTQGVPRLYQKYIGHDNNRDFYANTQAETKNMNRVMYLEWLPQIVFNHHQAGPPGTVLFCPPFRDPFNYNFDPLVINGVDAVGAAMMQRFLAENKPGATVRSGTLYSTWFNGGLRTTAYFHNIIGLLTETIGNPTPMSIPFIPAKQLPKADYLAPIAPQKWHFRQSVDYSVTANKAVLDYASRNREHLLHNIWRMGQNSIERGSTDSWTITPKIVEIAKEKLKPKGPKGGVDPKEFEHYFRDPAKRDARGYILPATQSDFLTATKFINVLQATGVKVHRATSDFEVAGKKYPAGSYVVKCAQAFRPHVLDLFEPQDHPDDFKYPGAAPTPPYDAAGYTLAFQMAVKFDRVLEAFEGPFELLQGQVPPPPAQVLDVEGAEGFFLSHKTNDSFLAVNRLLAAGEDVLRLQEPFVVKGITHPAGMFFVPRKRGTLPLLEKIAAEVGTRFVGSPKSPGKEAAALKQVRIGLWDRFGGSMPSGWTRWLLERFEFPFQVVMVDELDQGNLRSRFDVLIFLDDAAGEGRGGYTPTTIKMLGKFLEAGGTVLTVGRATSLASQLKLPISSYVASLDSTKYYIPTSVLRVRVNRANSLAWGIGEEVDVMFSKSPTFRLPENPEQSGLQRVAWFDSKTPLRSGWAFGQQHLEGGTAIVDAQVGKGRLVLFGPEILYRGQSHGTFKFLFNGIVQAGVK